MKGIVFLGDKKLEIQDFDDPSPGPDDVIIEIKASGMCGSDLKFYRANSGPSSLGLGGDDKPVIAGHEPCGTIVEIGTNVSKNNFQIDTRVMQHHYEGLHNDAALHVYLFENYFLIRWCLFQLLFHMVHVQQ